MKKGLVCVAKREIRRDNLCVLMQQTFAASFVTLLLSDSALLSYFSVPVLLFHPGLPTLSLSCLFISVLLSCPPIPALLSPSVLVLLLFLMPALSSCSHIPALLSLFMPVLLSSLVPALLSLFLPTSASYFVLSLAPTRPTSLALRTFK